MIPIEEYRQQKYLLQIELAKWQRYVKDQQTQHIVILEGRDAAGKTSTVKKFTEHLNPRYARIVALDKPSHKESHEWYWQRYINNFPRAGEITFWDRSWYNRACVEPVMGFCTQAQTDQFLEDCVKLEEIWTKSGIQIIKIFLEVSKDEQARRLQERNTQPLKTGKLSSVDVKAQALWDDYSRAIDTMMLKTFTRYCPWAVIDADDKWTSRLSAMQYVLANSKYPEKIM
jgi:polyphosphate kinase 2